MTETYYTVLGVPRTATAAEIKAAYRNLMREVHPDAVPNASPYWKKQAEEKAKEINEAYQVLSHPGKRRQYDQLLDSYQQAQAQQAQATHSAGASPSQTSGRGQRTQAPSGAWHHRPGYSQQSQYQSSATGQRPLKRPAWGVLCLMWAVSSSAGVYSARSAGDAAVAFAMAFGAWALVARAFSADIRRFLTRFGTTAAAKQPHYVAATICLLLCTLLVLRGALNGDRDRRKQAREEARVVWVLDQSGNCFPIDEQELRRRMGLRQISVADPRCVLRGSKPGTVSSSVREERHREQKSKASAAPDESPTRSERNPLVIKTAIPLQSTPAPWATVNHTTELKKFCTFNIGTWPCGFGVEETVAILKPGDRVKLLSFKTRTKDGSDVYRIRTPQGWEGWVTDRALILENRNAGLGSND